MTALEVHVRAITEQAVTIWLSGGWAMGAIATVAFVMFALGLHVAWGLSLRRITSVPEKTWRRWIEEPALRRGPLGELLNQMATCRSVKEVAAIFEQLQTAEIVPYERDLRVMRICVSAAPLFGLLGTVTGMLTTFAALSCGGGGEQTMNMIAGGISEALITTETGLLIALPGLFFQFQLARKLERYKTFLAHLETVCSQWLYRNLRTQEETHGPLSAIRIGRQERNKRRSVPVDRLHLHPADLLHCDHNVR